MNKERKPPVAEMDDLYTLAYGMTGTETRANQLVNRTYLHADRNTTTLELFRMFRTCYFDMSGFSDPSPYSAEHHDGSLRQRFSDVRLSVLLCEICAFTYRDISEITGMSVETLRNRLSWGRTLLMKALLLIHPHETRLAVRGGCIA